MRERRLELNDTLGNILVHMYATNIFYREFLYILNSEKVAQAKNEMSKDEVS